MAIRLEFISLIIPIEKIDRCYPGGFKALVSENRSMFNCGRLWHDEYLFRDGAMNPADMKECGEYWIDLGLVPYEERDGKKYWKDMCVVDYCGGLTYPCDWLEEDQNDFSVWLKGKPKGQVIGREEMEFRMGGETDGEY